MMKMTNSVGLFALLLCIAGMPATAPSTQSAGKKVDIAPLEARVRKVSDDFEELKRVAKAKWEASEEFAKQKSRLEEVKAKTREAFKAGTEEEKAAAQKTEREALKNFNDANMKWLFTDEMFAAANKTAAAHNALIDAVIQNNSLEKNNMVIDDDAFNKAMKAHEIHLGMTVGQIRGATGQNGRSLYYDDHRTVLRFFNWKDPDSKPPAETTVTVYFLDSRAIWISR